MSFTSRKIKLLAIPVSLLIVAVTAIAALSQSATTESPSATKLISNARESAPPDAEQLGELRTLALEIAKANGESDPVAIQLVSTSRSAANALDTGTTVNTDEDVYMISMVGKFTSPASSLDSGNPITGTAMSIVLDAKTKEMLDFSIGPVPASLGRLGQVIDLTRGS